MSVEDVKQCVCGNVVYEENDYTECFGCDEEFCKEACLKRCNICLRYFCYHCGEFESSINICRYCEEEGEGE